MPYLPKKFCRWVTQRGIDVVLMLAWEMMTSPAPSSERYFNPAGYRSKRRNYDVFRERIDAAGIPLVTVECAFGNRPFDLPPASCDPWGTFVDAFFGAGIRAQSGAAAVLRAMGRPYGPAQFAALRRGARVSSKGSFWSLTSGEV